MTNTDTLRRSVSCRASLCVGGGKTEKGLEGIEKSLLKKKSSLAKTRPNFIVRVSPCECESSLRLLPRVVNKICYRIKHACFHSSSHSPRFPISVCGGSRIQRCTRVRRHTVFHNLAPLAESDSPVWGGGERKRSLGEFSQGRIQP